MKSLWNEEESLPFAREGQLGLRVYTSRLLGRNPDLVLHGGGNTSVKDSRQNVFGNTEEVLFVKGSGWDLKTIEADGFSPVKLNYLKRLVSLPELSDTQMMQQLRAALLDPGAPTPSVEAILHALIPARFVDHTHADAVVAISNTPDGESVLRELFGPRVLVLPYIMPGFILARQVHEATRELDWAQLEGIVLLHHGIFTFSDDARTSYERMVELVTLAETWLESRKAEEGVAHGEYEPVPADYLALASLRRDAVRLAGTPLLLQWRRDDPAVGFSSRDDVEDIATRGPLTPDHTIHSKARAAILDREPAEGLEAFKAEYEKYYARNAGSSHTMLDPVFRYGVWKHRGMVFLASDPGRMKVVRDIAEHTIRAIQWGETLGGWTALPERDLFEIEYWELEQAKLKKNRSPAGFTGRVVLVTGAAAGIGRACVEQFKNAGACVVALDIDSRIETLFEDASVLGLRCDVTSSADILSAMHRGVESFGGIDTVISNAGDFPPSRELKNIDDELWEASMTLNLSSHMKVLRASADFLELGIEPSVVVVASKNVAAPGRGAAAYSVAKAGLTQLARIAALELGVKGIRVNTIHPNAVFDTGIWTEEVLKQRADAYGKSVAEYRTNNVLGSEITAADVARMAVLMAGPGFSKTTGAQVALDGGNERVI